MIFSLTDSNKLEPFSSNWNPKELEVERFLISSTEGLDEGPVLNEEIFGEQLLLVRNQARTSGGRKAKRADLLAIDKSANGVIIELKREWGHLGVETQALQYLAEFSATQGKDFLDRFWKGKENAEDVANSFLGAGAEIDEINRKTRVILVARSFDSALFSMGEWLSSLGVPFRCITYTPFKVDGKKFLSFSVAFDRSPDPVYRLTFRSSTRNAGYFWHNIGWPKEKWWDFSKRASVITAGFRNSPDDQGASLMSSFVMDDTIFAYASGYGALGWGVIRNPKSYRLLDPDAKNEEFLDRHRHRLDIEWKAVAPKIQDGISAAVVRSQFGIHHPLSTSVSIRADHAEKLKAALTEKFGSVQL